MNRREVALRLIGVGWYVGLCITLGTAAGLWLDSKFATLPWLTLIGVGLGTFVAFFGLYRMILPAVKREQDKNRENS
jgi:hypothetical protein